MKITIIGGGAAGICAAILLAPYHDVTILEGEDRIGKKLLTTGNGRCNLSNRNIEETRYHGNRDLIHHVLSEKGKKEALEFFQSLGLLTVEEGRKIYPATLQASTVVNLFLQELNHRKVQVLTGEKVLTIGKDNQNFQITTKNNTYSSEVVILATGGKTAPKTGSDGSGYQLAQSLGHRITDTFPGLIQLKGQSPYLKHLKGTKVVTKVHLHLDGKKVQEAQGELLFTEYGVSGPPIIDLSRQAIQGLRKGQKVSITYGLCNYLGEKQRQEMEELFYLQYHRTITEFLTGVVHKKFHQPILKELNLYPDTPCDQLEGPKKQQLFQYLFQSTMIITGYPGEKQGQVTCGGVAGEEVDGHCQSKYHKNLYLIGEVLDVDGDCGGFNLQWAWSTAMVVAEHLLKDSF